MQFLLLTLLAPLIAAATVRVQLSNNLIDEAIQREIPTTNIATKIGNLETDAFIVDLEGNSAVTCQAFSDAAGMKAVGGRFGTAGVTFNGGSAVTVGSLKCF